MGNNTKLNIKQANKKWRHEQKRRQKTRLEHVRSAQAVEKRGLAKNAKRRAEGAYVASLGAELI